MFIILLLLMEGDQPNNNKRYQQRAAQNKANLQQQQQKNPNLKNSLRGSNSNSNNSNLSDADKEAQRMRYRLLDQYFGAALRSTATESTSTTDYEHTSTANNVTGIYKGSASYSVSSNPNRQQESITKASVDSPVSSILVPTTYHVAAGTSTSTSTSGTSIVTSQQQLLMSDALLFVPPSKSSKGQHKQALHTHTHGFNSTTLDNQQEVTHSAKLALQLETVRQAPYDELKEVDLISDAIVVEESWMTS